MPILDMTLSTPALRQRVSSLRRPHPGQVAELVFHTQFVDGLKGHVGVDGIGAKAQQHCHVVDLAGITGLNDEGGAGAGALSDQMLVHRRGQQQGGDRGVALVGLPVGEHDETGAAVDCRRDLATYSANGVTHTRAHRGLPGRDQR